MTNDKGKQDEAVGEVKQNTRGRDLGKKGFKPEEILTAI